MKCPYCKKNVIDASGEGDTLLQCNYCGYTIENGVVTRRSNISNILKVKEVLNAEAQANTELYKQGMSKDDFSDEEYIELISDYLKEKE